MGKVAVVPALPGTTALARVSGAVRAERANTFAQQRASEDEAGRRARLLAVAIQSHGSLIEPLHAELLDGIGTAGEIEQRPRAEVLFEAKIAGARLVATLPFEARDRAGPFEVVATAALTVHRPQQSRSGWLGRAHSRWYCNAGDVGEFAWYELAFMANPFGGGQPVVVPYTLSPESAGIAFSNVMGSQQLAWPVSKLDRDDLGEFIDRWVGWFCPASGFVAGPASCGW